METSLLRSRVMYALVAALVLLMAFGLGSPFEKGGMDETNKKLALAGLLAGAGLLGAAAGLRGWAEKVLLPLPIIPVLLLLAIGLVTKILEYAPGDPEREPFNHEFYCGLLYAGTLLGYQGLLRLYRQLRYPS